MNYSDIQNLFYQLSKTSTDDVPVATLNLYTQPAEDEVAAIINECEGMWPYDDANRTDLPQALFALTATVQDYNLGTAIHTIDRVEIKDTGGIWHRIEQYNQQTYKDGNDLSLSTDEAVAGRPTTYRIAGTSIFLTPIPNYTQANSLKVYHTRGPLKFDYTTSKFTDGTGSTSSEPGYASLFHSLIAKIAARNWCIANSLENSQLLLEDITNDKFQLRKFLGTRNRDRRRRMRTSTADSNK